MWSYRVDADVYFLPFVDALLRELVQRQPLLLAIDGSEVGRCSMTLMISVIYQKARAAYRLDCYWRHQRLSPRRAPYSTGRARCYRPLCFLRIATMYRADFQAKMESVQQEVDAVLRQGTIYAYDKTAETCRDILKREAFLWTFVHVEGLDPTNNLGERQVRPGVIWRKMSFGAQSEAGSRFAERIMTVVSTLKQQRRNALDYLTEACEAAHSGRPAPSLLPTVSTTLNGYLKLNLGFAIPVDSAIPRMIESVR